MLELYDARIFDYKNFCLSCWLNIQRILFQDRTISIHFWNGPKHLPFGTAYLCEATFSALMFVKPKYWYLWKMFSMCYIGSDIFLCMPVFCFVEAGSPVAQVGFEYSIQWEMTLSSWFFFLNLYLPVLGLLMYTTMATQAKCPYATVNSHFHLISMQLCFLL